MANFLDILNAVTASLGGLAQITNQQAKEREQRDLEGAKLLAQLKDYEFVPAQGMQRPAFLDAMRGIQGTAEGQRVVNVGGQPFVVRQRQTLGERMPNLFAPQPVAPRVPSVSAAPAQPMIQFGEAEPVTSEAPSLATTQPFVPQKGGKLSDTFVAKAEQVAKRLGMQFHDFLSIMDFETGGTFSPAIRNKAGSGAVGLIQFLPQTAEAMGTTTANLAAMQPEQQLDYVEKYFTPYVGKLGNLQDAYMAVLYPKAIGKPPATVLFRHGTEEYRQNAGLDTQQKGYITVADTTGKIRDYASRTGGEVAKQAQPSAMAAIAAGAAGMPGQNLVATAPSVAGATMPLPSGAILPPLPQPPAPMGEMPTFDRNELAQYVINDPIVQQLKNERSADALAKLQARTQQLQTEFRAEKRLSWQGKMDIRRQEWQN